MKNSRSTAFVLCAALSVAALVPATAAAQADDPAQTLRGLGQEWLQTTAATASFGDGRPHRIEVTVGELDSRLRLAPCSRIEPYLPPGARLWGSSKLGIRCAQGALRWNVFLPINVRAIGPVWVARQAMPAGKVMAESDWVRGEADWAAHPSPVVQEPSQWVGLTSAGPVAAGETLRLAMLRMPQVFPAGAQVRLITEGPGFTVSVDAVAINAGYAGQPTRVRTENGRIVSGAAMDTRTVRFQF